MYLLSITTQHKLSSSALSIQYINNYMYVYVCIYIQVTVRDTVRLHIEMVQQHINAKKVACVVGGSMGESPYPSTL